MKKYFFIGLVVGTGISLFLYYMQRKKSEGLEFHDFVDSLRVADDLFGNAFQQSPDKL